MNRAPFCAFVGRILSTIGLFLLVSLASSAQTYIFGRADFPVGNSPNAIVTGDFNGDGIIDAAVTNSYDNTVSILLGRPDATFAPQITYATGPLPVAIVAGDFNGDGNLDLAVTNGDCTPPHESEPPQCSPSTMGILMGNGDGTFQPQVTYPVGTLPASIVTADLNGDGKLDLAVVNVFDNNISILLGNGNGSFQSPVNYPVALQASYFELPSLVLGDFNGDGKMDLAVAGADAVFVLLGNGDGTFQAALQSACSSCGSAMAVGDFNRDGKLDLVVGGQNQGTSVLLGLGDGTFYLNATYAPSAGGEVAVADLNGDGKLDLIIPQGAQYLTYVGGSVAVQLGNGDGTFQSTVLYGTGLVPWGINLADFNGDGRLDVAVTNSVCGLLCTPAPPNAGSVSILFGFGDGTFVGTSDYSLPPSPNLSNGSMLSADFANNGNLDIAVAGTSQSAIGLLLGNGDGTFQYATTDFPTGTGTAAIAAGDLRNNGDLDLVSANNPCTPTSCPPGTVSVLLGNGDGTFQTHVDYTAGIQPWGVALGSFRNNGTLDIAAANYQSNSISILLGVGDGTFQTQVAYPTGANPQQIAIGDFNKDGYPDLAVATGSGTSVLLGKGNGTFDGQVSYGPAASGLITADFNGDGNLDLVLSTGFILIGNGDGTFQAPIAIPIQGASLAAADFNGDGKLDLAAVAVEEPAALLALGNGDGTFQPPVGYWVETAFAWALTVGDFNGDGVPDWAAINGTVGTIGVMLSTPFKSISPGSLNFGSQGVGTTSLPRTITFSNPSNVKFNIASIAVTGNFAETNTCGASLTVGENCTIAVIFSPTVTGQQSGAVIISDSTRISPVSVPLSGNGVSGSFLTPYPGHQNFSPQVVGTRSASAAVQLVNTGNASLSITGVSITGTNSSDFTQTNNCGSSIMAGGSCTATVTFAPQAPGSRAATLSITDSASGSPQSAMLSGTGLGAAPGFSLGPASGSSASQTVAAGQSAKFSLALAPTGPFSGTVNLACSIAPVVSPAPTCTLSSSSVQITGGTSQNVSVTVATTAPSTSAVMPFSRSPSHPDFLIYAGILLLSAYLLLHGKQRRRILSAPVVVLLLVAGLGCGHSSSRSTTKKSGTPAGSYTATVTAVSGSNTSNTKLTVIVQ